MFADGDDAVVLIPAAAIVTVVSAPAAATVAPTKLSAVCDVPLEVPPSFVSTFKIFDVGGLLLLSTEGGIVLIPFLDLRNYYYAN